MKTGKWRLLSFILVFAGALFVNSCNNHYDLRVDLQTWFDNDTVKIEVDGAEVYNNVISTQAVLGVAEVKSMNYPEGNHTVKITVNNSYAHSETVNVNHHTFIGVSYNQTTHDIAFTYYTQPPVYE